jgi:hypothetical protein
MYFSRQSELITYRMTEHQKPRLRLSRKIPAAPPNPAASQSRRVRRYSRMGRFV